MAEEEKDRSTLPEPILVGSGPEGEQAAEFLLTMADWVLREQEGGLLGPLEGDLSEWVTELARKPVQFERRDPLSHTKGAILQAAMKEALAMAVDPSNKTEKPMADLIGSISPQDLQRMFEAIQAGQVGEAEKIRSEVIEKLQAQLRKRITPQSIPAFAALVKRGRAAQATALCCLLHKDHPLSLIAQARKGNRQAVLKLIKVDNLFLNDHCTAQVIREAALQKDRPYLEQLARAIKYKPKTGWRQGCRLYLYLLFNFDPRLSASAKIQLRIDPDGVRFRTFEAFQKFVERSKNEFDRVQASWVENPERKA
jgi:hypothetical protein